EAPSPTQKQRSRSAPRRPTTASGLSTRWRVSEPSGKSHEMSLPEVAATYSRGGFEPGTLVCAPGKDQWLPPYDHLDIMDRALPAGDLAVRPPQPTFSDVTVMLGAEESEKLSRLAQPSQPNDPPSSQPPHFFEDDDVDDAMDAFDNIVSVSPPQRRASPSVPPPSMSRPVSMSATTRPPPPPSAPPPAFPSRGAAANVPPSGQKPSSRPVPPPSFPAARPAPAVPSPSRPPVPPSASTPPPPYSAPQIPHRPFVSSAPTLMGSAPPPLIVAPPASAPGPPPSVPAAPPPSAPPQLSAPAFVPPSPEEPTFGTLTRPPARRKSSGLLPLFLVLAMVGGALFGVYFLRPQLFDRGVGRIRALLGLESQERLPPKAEGPPFDAPAAGEV